MAYSAGTLPEAFSLVISAHVSMCDDCRAAVESYDTIGGALVEDTEGAQMDMGALDAVMQRIDALSSQPVETKPKSKGGLVPAPLQDYIGDDLDKIKWRPVGMGVKQAILKTSKEATARLLFIPAGTAVPDHGHNGTEITLVLKGAFLDEHDRFARGDVEVATEDHHHTPVADISEDCICLAVTDAPLKFSGLMPRLVQPFVGI